MTGHLDDAALAAAWTDAAIEGGEPSHPHLEACAACRARMAEFREWMEEVRIEGTATADEAFPAERLAAQQAHILRRLEAAERPARVISFPAVSRPMSHAGSHTRRWITAAAAAGLIVGVAVGQLMDVRQTLHRASAAGDYRTVEPPRSDRPENIQPVSLSAVDPDAAFMAELDASLSRQSAGELRALDEITPRAPFTEGRQ